MPFSLLPEPLRRMPLLAVAWTAVAVLHVLLWVGKLVSRAYLGLGGAVLFGVDTRQPVALWSWFAGPLFVLTLLVQWRRGHFRAPWGYLAIAALWLILLVSLPHVLTWLAGGTVAAALVTVALFVLPLALSVHMTQLIVEQDPDARAA